MKRKDKLTEAIEEQEKIANIESAKLQDLIFKKEKRDLIPLTKKCLGKCFKFRNSAGSSYAKWWLYVKVVKIRGLIVYYITFEKTCFEKIIFEGNNKTVIWRDIEVFNSADGYIEITKEEFELERKALLQEIKTLGKG